MKQYPRIVYKTKEDTLRVEDADQEVNAANDGYESHWDSDINEAQKGTDKEILRGEPVEAVEAEPVEVKAVEAPEDPYKDEIIPKQKRKRRTRAEMAKAGK